MYPHLLGRRFLLGMSRIFRLTGLEILDVVRQGSLVVATGRAVLPATLPQIVFAIVMLGIGLFAGRASRGLTGRSIAEATFEGGEGI